MSSAKKYHCTIDFSWEREGLWSRKWRVVTKPSNTCRGMMMHSWAAAIGWSQGTTNRPSRDTVATFKYRLTSLILVAFFEGLIPCVMCACVLLRSGHSLWTPNQVFLFVKGSSILPSTMSDTCVGRITESSIWFTKRKPGTQIGFYMARHFDSQSMTARWPLQLNA